MTLDKNNVMETTHNIEFFSTFGNILLLNCPFVE